MSNELDKLKQALDAGTPAPSDDARNKAIFAAMESFEENFQGSADEARPTSEQTQWWGLISQGAVNMFRRLTTRETLLATASFATIAIAVGVTGQFTNMPFFSQDAVNGVIETPETVDGYDSELRAEVVEEVVVTQPSTVVVKTEGTVVADALMAAPTLAPVAEPEAGFVASMAAPSSHDMVVAPNSHDRDSYERERNVSLGKNTEEFPDDGINPLKVTSDEPVSTFSIDVDTASYSYVRSSLMDGYLPTRDAVRTEEMINYFSYDYPVPEADSAPFSTSVSVIQTPWNEDTQLLHIGIKGYELAVEDRPPVNLVFLLDTSGSMNSPDKLPLLINSFRLLLGNLTPQDKVAIVAYAGSAGTVLEPTSAADTRVIMESLRRLSAGGSTAGAEGLRQAYNLAEQMAADGDATSRVILATDGDFNVGISDPDELQAFVEDKRDTGVYLSVLGFGRGNYNDHIMQTLAQNGNGVAAYIDTLAEAQKVLVDQVGAALFPIAQDVKIQIEFNPHEIAEYRLIGYETRTLNREDFNNDQVDAGEIGSGHSVTAIYEITPVGSPAVMVDELRYGTDEVDSVNNGEYAFLKLRYKNPGEETSILLSTAIMPDADAGLGDEVQFAAAVAGFGQILRGDDMMNGWEISDALALAQEAKGDDPYGYRAEFLTLLRLADTLN